MKYKWGFYGINYIRVFYSDIKNYWILRLYKYWWYYNFVNIFNEIRFKFKIFIIDVWIF